MRRMLGERTEDVTLQHVPQGHLTGSDLQKARERDQWGSGQRAIGIKGQVIPEEVEEDVWGKRSREPQSEAGNPGRERHPAAYITQVPLNFLPVKAKLDRGARGLSPGKGLCEAGAVTQLIEHLVCKH